MKSFLKLGVLVFAFAFIAACGGGDGGGNENSGGGGLGGGAKNINLHVDNFQKFFPLFAGDVSSVTTSFIRIRYKLPSDTAMLAAENTLYAQGFTAANGGTKNVTNIFNPNFTYRGTFAHAGMSSMELEFSLDSENYIAVPALDLIFPSVDEGVVIQLNQEIHFNGSINMSGAFDTYYKKLIALGIFDEADCFITTNMDTTGWNCNIYGKNLSLQFYGGDFHGGGDDIFSLSYYIW